MLKRPENLTAIESYTTVNNIYPNTERSLSLGGFSYLDSYIAENQTYIAFIIRTQCKDKVTGSLENHTYWFKHLAGPNILLDLTILEKKQFLSI